MDKVGDLFDKITPMVEAMDFNKENIYDTLIDGMEHLIKEGYFNKEYLEE